MSIWMLILALLLGGSIGAFVWLLVIIDKECPVETEAQQKHGRQLKGNNTGASSPLLADGWGGDAA